MSGDHLTARQTSVTTLAQHPLTDTDSPALYYRSTVTTPTWNDREAASTIWLPRCGKTGCYLNDVRVQPYQAAHSTTSTGVTVECVFTTTTNGFNFFGGLWGRDIVYYNGPYAYQIGISYTGTNDSISDTTARAYPRVSDIGQDRIDSRTVHSRPVLNDGLPHHLCLTHAGSPTLTGAVKLYVDGTLVETCTLKTGCEMFGLEANNFNAGVEAYFTQPAGSISHACLTPLVLPVSEIQARANLVNKGTGSRLTDQGTVLAWDASTGTWIPAKASASAAWLPVSV